MGHGLIGKYRGQVKDVIDPEMRGRVLVVVPSLMDDVTLGWAESCFMPGEFNLPRVGDFVWVEFEQGEIDRPVWTGIMPTREYVKTHLLSYYADRGFYDPNVHVIRTSNHQGIHFRDTDKASDNNIIILDQKGSFVKLDGKSGNLQLKPTNQLHLD